MFPVCSVVQGDINKLGHKLYPLPLPSLHQPRHRLSDAVNRLVEQQIAVRNGHFYALRCLEALGIQDTDEGIIHISLVHYNSSEDVNRLVEGLGELYPNVANV